MANWIKVDIDTPSKDAIFNIMEDCACSQADAFLAWFNLYVWFDSVTADGTVNATPADIDRRAGLNGIARSLVASGWIAFQGRRCVITNWAEHNGKSAKARALHAARMANLRYRKGHPVPKPVTQAPSRTVTQTPSQTVTLPPSRRPSPR